MEQLPLCFCLALGLWPHGVSVGPRRAVHHKVIALPSHDTGMESLMYHLSTCMIFSRRNGVARSRFCTSSRLTCGFFKTWAFVRCGAASLSCVGSEDVGVDRESWKRIDGWGELKNETFTL